MKYENKIKIIFIDCKYKICNVNHHAERDLFKKGYLLSYYGSSPCARESEMSKHILKIEMKTNLNEFQDANHFIIL